MNRFKFFFSLISAVFMFVFSSCGNDNDGLDGNSNIELKVASSLDVKNGVSSLIIKELGTGYLFPWTPYYEKIVGFDYEEEYEYLLTVDKVEQPISSSKPSYYKLKKVISKEKKQTVFTSNSFSVGNSAVAEGEYLSAADKETIEKLIKQSSPFYNCNGITLNVIDFQKNNEGVFVLNNDKSGKYSIENNDNGVILTLSFDKKTYVYKSITSEKPSSMSKYFILDVTAEYQKDYPQLESAASVIKLSVML
ncbi:MAG: DUF4377 domain-containing protein [Bacteroidales bacterium]|nr:DUF4377 domain-containing protein [Bacteroidales bacterium]